MSLPLSQLYHFTEDASLPNKDPRLFLILFVVFNLAATLNVVSLPLTSGIEEGRTGQSGKNLGYRVNIVDGMHHRNWRLIARLMLPRITV